MPKGKGIENHNLNRQSNDQHETQIRYQPETIKQGIDCLIDRLLAALALHFVWVLAVSCGLFIVACELSRPVACEILAPRPGIEPTSPALEGEFLTTEPPGKSL